MSCKEIKQPGFLNFAKKIDGITGKSSGKSADI
jgi:hypothetical protein